MKKSIIIIGLLFIVLLVIVVLLSTRNKKIVDFNIYFFAAGKSDSFIISKDDKIVLIDTGTKNIYKDIDDYLKEHHINKIDYLIITHFDKDHVGSAGDIINNYQVDNVLQSNYPKESKVYTKYLEALDIKNITPVTVRENMHFSISDIIFDIIPPVKEEYESDPSNNSSLITSITYKDTSYLFTGDIEKDRLEEFNNNNSRVYDFIKMPHHGDYDEGIEELITNIKPKYAVITSSNEEKESKKVVKVLDKNRVKTYYTRIGSISLDSDGSSIYINYK